MPHWSERTIVDALEREGVVWNRRDFNMKSADERQMGQILRQPDPVAYVRKALGRGRWPIGRLVRMGTAATRWEIMHKEAASEIAQLFYNKALAEAREGSRMASLRSRMIRLAWERPELRGDLLPLVSRTARWRADRWWDELMDRAEAFRKARQNLEHGITSSLVEGATDPETKKALQTAQRDLGRLYNPIEKLADNLFDLKDH